MPVLPSLYPRHDKEKVSKRFQMALRSKIIPELKISALRPWYSECPTGLNNINITWKLVMNIHSKTQLQMYWIKTFILSRFLNGLNAHWFWEAFFCLKALLELEKRCTLARGHDIEKFTTARIRHKNGESNKVEKTAQLDMLIKATRASVGKKNQWMVLIRERICTDLPLRRNVCV